nr:MAG: hypothetical protein BECKSD772D_GA0070982_101033 [Candidatus Kentron sp. SD]
MAGPRFGQGTQGALPDQDTDRCPLGEVSEKRITGDPRRYLRPFDFSAKRRHVRRIPQSARSWLARRYF